MKEPDIMDFIEASGGTRRGLRAMDRARSHSPYFRPTIVPSRLAMVPFAP